MRNISLNAFRSEFKSFWEKDNRILSSKASAIVLTLLCLLAILRYSKHWIVKALSFGGYSALEVILLIVIAAAGFILFRKLPRLSSQKLSQHRITTFSPRKHDPLLTLRAVACFYVLLGHSFLIAFPPSNLMDALRSHAFYTYFLPEPWAGVWIFFTLSGYLMGKGFFLNRYSGTTLGAFSFYRNRLLRIFPMYLAAMLIVAALIEPEFFHPENFLSAFNLLILFDFVGDPVIPNQALWSVGTELEFYIFVPFLFVLLRGLLTTRRNVALIYSLLWIIGLILRILVSKYLPANIYGGSFLGNFDFFLCGLTLSAFTPLMGKVSPRRHLIAASMGGIVAYYLIAAYCCQHGRMLAEETSRFIWQVILPSITILMTSAIIFMMEMGSLEKESWLVREIVKKTQLFGLLTYSLYAWHEPIIIADHQLFKGQNMSLIMSCGMTLMNLGKTFGVACLFYYCLEKYFDEKRMAYSVSAPESA